MADREPTIEDRLTALYEPEPKETEAVTEEPQVEAVQEQAEEVQEVENVQEVDDNEDSTDIQGASEDSQTSEIETLEDIALAMDKPLEDILGNIKAKTKVNGVESEISLAEVIAGYQRNQDYTHGKMALSDEKKALQSAVETFRQEQEARITNVNALSAHLENELVSDFNKVNWDELRVDDPAEYSAKRTEFAERQNQLLNIKEQLGKEAQALIQEQQTEFSASQQQKAIEQANIIREKIPEWSNQEIATSEFTEISKTLSDVGYSEQEIGNIIDHRDILIARYAMLYLKSVKNTDVAKQKVKNVPKLLKPGSPKSTTQKHSESANKLRQRARKSGTTEDAALRYMQVLADKAG